jgi:hypothetical protein
LSLKRLFTDAADGKVMHNQSGSGRGRALTAVEIFAIADIVLIACAFATALASKAGQRRELKRSGGADS